MGKRNTPDIESIGDVERFCLLSWFPLDGSVIRVEGTDKRAVVGYIDGEGNPHEIQFIDFIERVVLGMPESTYVLIDGVLHYVVPNNHRLGQRQQGFHFRYSGISGFPTFNMFANGNKEADIARQIYYPRHYTLREAVGMLERGDAIGAPLSNDLGLIATETGPLKLVYQHEIVGQLDKMQRPVLNAKYKSLDVIVESVCQLR